VDLYTRCKEEEGIGCDLGTEPVEAKDPECLSSLCTFANYTRNMFTDIKMAVYCDSQYF